MSLTIDGIELTEEHGYLFWENEMEWSKVGQTQDRSVTGAFLVQEQFKTYGREISLIGGDEAMWIPRSIALQLKAKEAQLNKKFTVTLNDGQSFYCRFNRSGGNPALQMRPVWRYSGIPEDDTLYAVLAIKFITVEP